MAEDELYKFEVTSDPMKTKSNLKGDWKNFFLLIMLYTMQGLPLGLAITFPIILQTKKVSYREQAIFSLVALPYSVKILWAPIVDSLYVQRIGRRKSWLVPVQYLMGLFLYFTAHHIDDWLPESGKPNVKALVISFCVISVLAATQDVVVDGWALTMLKRNNVGHASTCNGTGLALGVIISTFSTVLLTSEDFCNKYLRFTHETGGIITMKGFFYFWSAMFIIITTYIGIFKREKDINRLDNGYVKINVIQNYKLLWDILKLPSIRVLVVALLTMKIGFAATDGVSKLKLIDAGMSKEDLTIITISMYIVKFIVPLVVSKYTSGPKPMNAYMNLMPIRLLWSVTYVILIYYTPILIIKNNGAVNVPMYYYLILIFISTIHEILSYTMFLFTIGFFSRISDSRFGGTYMTMLSTIASLGWVASNTVALRMIDILTFSKCSNDTQNDCSTQHFKNACKTNGGDCVTIVNGYYVEVALCIMLGFVWYFIYKNIIKNLQEKSLSNWLVCINQPN